VKQLLVRGDQVAATTRSIQRLTEHIDSVIPTALARNFLPLQVDLTDEYAVGQAIATACKTFGHIDVVVNNAGYAPPDVLEELPPSDVRQCFAINTTAALTVMNKAIPFLRQQRSGYILNISSLAACASATDNSLYAATKYAVLGLSDILAEEVNRFNIAITVVAPVAMQSRLHSREYDVWENIRNSDHAATSLIRLTEQSTPPPILLIGGNTFTTHRKEVDNEIQLIG
jgi:NAD(P)-dependent dehydrogenase (short-subunit alcohol dehydrogenase family)